MTLLFFGSPWDAPVFSRSDTTQVAPPVGIACAHCGQLIRLGDQGFLRPTLDRPLGPDSFDLPPPNPALLPIHRECEMAMVVGPLAHVQGRCARPDQCLELMIDEGRSIRADALAVWEWVTTMGVWTPQQLRRITSLIVEELTCDPHRRNRKDR